ncbi:hypothetical protein ACIP9H_29480 [Streptomyces sp. NPDC088732]|uniref:hypothetical protein n=1 Tax=Streptomyces sp. NPDC088732 TaxID=3365879 RepID=UPI00380DC616
MNSTTAGTLFSIPGLDGGTVETQAPAPVPEPTPLGLRPAAARIVITDAPDMNDTERRPLAFLVVTCPFCDAQHIHTAGHPGALRLCLRRSRCVGRPAGAYFFPEVQL